MNARGGHWEVAGFQKKYEDLPDRVAKRYVKNLDAVQPLTKPVVPYSDPPPVGLGQIQIARGCSFHCGFCGATYREAPYRERSPELMLEAFKDVVEITGSPNVAPLTLELGTYSRKKALIKDILETVTPELSMPSLRIDVFGGDPLFGQLAVQAQKKNVTVAVEGNSQKMREVVSKGITEDDVLKSVSNAIAAGYNSAKLYMIANLPGEDEDDVAEIADLCRKIDELRRSAGSNMKIRLSWKPLTIQANTPLQWFAARSWRASLEEPMRQIRELGFGTQMGDETKSALGNYNQLAELADDVAGEILLDVAVESDVVTYGSMGKHVFHKLEEVLPRYDRSLGDYYRAKAEDEVFAWDVVDTRISKKYLLRHYRNVLRRVNDDPELKVHGQGFLEKFGACSIGCTQCGACDHDDLVRMKDFAATEDEPVKLADVKIMDRTSVVQKALLRVHIDPHKRFVTREHWEYNLRRACHMAGLTVATHSLKFATEKVRTLKPWWGGREFIEIGFVKPTDMGALAETLNENTSPYGLRVEEAREVPPTHKMHERDLDSILWELEVDQPRVAMIKAVNDARDDESREVSIVVDEYRIGRTRQTEKLNEVLYSAWHEIDGAKGKLVMQLRPDVSPYDALTAVLGKRTDAYRYTAVVRACLTDSSDDAFTPQCEACPEPIPWEFGKLLDERFCHRCVGEKTRLDLRDIAAARK